MDPFSRRMTENCHAAHFPVTLFHLHYSARVISATAIYSWEAHLLLLACCFETYTALSLLAASGFDSGRSAPLAFFCLDFLASRP